MAYFLSYIERKGHVALMLSEQHAITESPKVLCELGFSCELGISIVNYFGTYKGRVGEETNASKALFSTRSDVKHRTYEISNAEMEKFFQILNHDRRINSEKISASDRVIKYEGGPDYQKLTHNCKLYALNVFKQLGVIEAEELSNFLIQRPGTRVNALKSLSQSVLSCPIKEKLDHDVRCVLNNIQQEIHPLNLKERHLSKQSIAAIERLHRTADILHKERKKLGVNRTLNAHFQEISLLLDAIPLPSDVISRFKQELSLVNTMAEEVTQMSKNGILPIYWKPNFPVSKRLKLDNFSPEEQALTVTKIKTNEMSDGLELLLSAVHTKINTLNPSKKGLFLDLNNLIDLICEAQQAIDTSRLAFLKATETQNVTALLKACAKQHRVLNEITWNLHKKVHCFQPRSKETSLFVRFINRIISYFKKDFITIDNLHALINNSVHTLIKSSPLWHLQEEPWELNQPESPTSEEDVLNVLKNLPSNVSDIPDEFLAKYTERIVEEMEALIKENHPPDYQVKSATEITRNLLADLERFKDRFGGAPNFKGGIPTLNDEDAQRSLFGVPLAAVKDWFRMTLIKQWPPSLFWTAIAKLFHVGAHITPYEDIHVRIQRFGLLLANKKRFFAILESQNPANYADFSTITGLAWHPEKNSPGIEKHYINALEDFLTVYYENAKVRGADALIEYYQSFSGVCFEDRLRTIEHYILTNPSSAMEKEARDAGHLADYSRNTPIIDVICLECAEFYAKNNTTPTPQELWDHLVEKGVAGSEFSDPIHGQKIPITAAYLNTHEIRSHLIDVVVVVADGPLIVEQLTNKLDSF